MISNDDDDDQVDFNESNLDFSILSEINDTKIQCKDEYNKLVVQILNRIVLKYSKSLKINQKNCALEQEVRNVKKIVPRHRILILPNTETDNSCKE